MQVKGALSETGKGLCLSAVCQRTDRIGDNRRHDLTARGSAFVRSGGRRRAVRASDGIFGPKVSLVNPTVIWRHHDLPEVVLQRGLISLCATASARPTRL